MSTSDIAVKYMATTEKPN